jgi:energy-coupling factor transporter ATP-binding protein EcfA2
MTASGSPVVIETRGLSKRYRTVAALSEATITVPEGRVSALIGPNGAGKTTLLRLLAGLARPTGGEVAVLGSAPRQDPAYLAAPTYCPGAHPARGAAACSRRPGRHESVYMRAAMIRRLSWSEGEPELVKVLSMCFSTTPPVITSRSAMAVLERPSATSASTSRSCAVSAAGESARRLAPSIWLTTSGSTTMPPCATGGERR